jgi:hypothetical protein
MNVGLGIHSLQKALHLNQIRREKDKNDVINLHSSGLLVANHSTPDCISVMKSLLDECKIDLTSPEQSFRSTSTDSSISTFDSGNYMRSRKEMDCFEQLKMVKKLSFDQGCNHD